MLDTIGGAVNGALPIASYCNSKAKAKCWATIVWLGDDQEPPLKLTWEELGKRIAHFYKRKLNAVLRKQSLTYLGKRLATVLSLNPNQPISPSQLITAEQYKKSRLGEWLYNAIEAIKNFPLLWKYYSLQVFLDQADAIAVLRHYGAQPGDFVFRLPTQLNDTGNAFVTLSQGSKLVCTYVMGENGSFKYGKLDISDTTREDVKFIQEKSELQRVLCLDALGRPRFLMKQECMFNDKQRNCSNRPNTTVNTDEYLTY